MTSFIFTTMDYVNISKDIATWLHNKLDGLVIGSDKRTRTVAGCFDTVMEHQVAISILLENQLYGSAFALARPAFEGYVRGLWLNMCATDAQVTRFLKGKLDLAFHQLINEIKKEDDYAAGIISDAKKAWWTILNGFTHTGSVQVFRRNSVDFIEPNYSNRDINEIADFVNVIALLAGSEIASLSKTEPEKLLMEFEDKMEKYTAHTCVLTPILN